MGDESLIEDIVRALPEQYAPTRAIRLLPCGGGGNNRVFEFDAAGSSLVAKRYFSHPSDSRDRLGAEYAFLQYAQHAGIECVPRPVARDAERHLGIYQRVPGQRLRPGEVGPQQVAQAVAFFLALNRPEQDALARRLPHASEAGFSVAQHFAVVERRLARLQTIPGDAAADAAARDFVRTLVAAWNVRRDAIEQRLRVAGESMDAEVAGRCISPSDFGFHNALVEADGRIHFIDFEYAGWDDPAKMAGDFFCQPAIPVPMTLFEDFLATAMSFSPHAEALRARARLLLPVFQVKWCCILLNDFLPDDARRRRFADPSVHADTRKADQLGKARRLLESVQR